MTLSGEPAPDQRTPPLRFRTSSIPNATSFTERIERSLLAEDTAPDGYALVTAVTRGRRAPTDPNVLKLIFLAKTAGPFIGIPMLVHPSVGNLATLLLMSPFATFGALIFRAVFEGGIRHEFALRRRGMTVAGRRSDHGKYRVDFTTADGRRFTGVTVTGFSTPRRGAIDVTYDPRRPRIARGPLGFVHYAVMAVFLAVGSGFAFISLLTFLAVLTTR